MSSHSFGILMLLQFVGVCVSVSERERECVTIKSKWRTNSKHDTNILKQKPKYLFNTAKVCVRLLTFFHFFMLSAEKLLTGDEKHRKKAFFLIPLVYWDIAILCVCVHVSHWKESARRTASMTHKTCEQKTKNKTMAEVHVSQWKESAWQTASTPQIYKHKAKKKRKKKKNSSGVRTACMCQNEKKALANRGKHETQNLRAY